MNESRHTSVAYLQGRTILPPPHDTFSKIFSVANKKLDFFFMVKKLFKPLQLYWFSSNEWSTDFTLDGWTSNFAWTSCLNLKRRENVVSQNLGKLFCLQYYFRRKYYKLQMAPQQQEYGVLYRQFITIFY